MHEKTTEARVVLDKAEFMRESLIAGISKQSEVIAKLRSETRLRNQNLVDAEEMIVERDRKIEALRSDLHSMQLRSKSMRQKLDAQVAAKTKILDETLARYRKAVHELDELRAGKNIGNGDKSQDVTDRDGSAAATTDIVERMRDMEKEIEQLRREKRHLEKRSKFLEKRANRRS